jgi:zinc protease
MSHADRTEAPLPGAIRSFDFPPVHKDRLGNGLEIRSVQAHRLPIVTMSLMMDAGESSVSGERAGLAVLTGDSLEGGTATRSGAELAEALESIGAGLSVGTGWDATTVSLSCLPERLDEAMTILAEIVLRPGFPADEVDRVRGQRLAAIQQRKMDPSSIASDAARRLTYAEGTPYGRSLGGDVESVESFSPEAAAGFVEAQYRPESAGLILVGDLDQAEMKAMVQRCFGDWSGKAPERPSQRAEPRSRERRVVIVDRPDAVQSEIRIGHIGQPRSTSDYFPLLVFNTILGGAFTSRLNLNLREEHGFTYGVRSGFAFRRDAGPWTISTAVGTEVTADAVREAVSEVEGLLQDGPTQDEVEASRDYMAGIFPLRLETTGQIASQVAELLLYDLPDDYHATYREQIRSVTRDDAMEAARRCIRPDEITVVIAGDASVVREPLEELGLGPVEVEQA